MTRENARALLSRIGILRGGCDLDLLVFFGRHPRSLLSSEALAAFLGYDVSQIADSLERLLGAQLLRRTQTSLHAARYYVLVSTSSGHDWLPSLLALASSREGRLALREAIAQRARESIGSPGPTPNIALKPQARHIARLTAGGAATIKTG